MKALVWHGTNDVRVERVPDPKILNPRDAIVKITSTAICGSDLHLLDGYIPTMQTGDILGHEFMGEVVEVGHGQQEAQGRRPRRRAVHHRLRRLLLLPARAVVAVRQLEPERLDGREALRLLHLGAVRLLAPDRRLCRRPGAVRARAVRRRRAAEDSRRHARRAGAVPVRHLPDRLHGGGELQHQAGRHRRGLGLRAGRAVRDPQRLAARRRAGDRHRRGARAAAHGQGEEPGRDDRLRARGRLRAARRR